MHRDALAEWILGQVMSKGRAAALVGDLSEGKGEHKALAFWLSIAGIVLATTWTWIVAIAIGIYLASSSVWFLNLVFFGQALDHPYSALWSKLSGALAATTTILLVLAPYAAVRYGPKDKVTRATFAILALVLMMISFWWRSIVLSLCLAAVLVGLTISLCGAERRRALAVVGTTVAAGFLSLPVANGLVSLVHQPAFGCELQGCVFESTTPGLAVSKVLLAIPVVLLCTFLHARLFENDPPPRAQSEEYLYARGTAYSSVE